MGSLIKIEAIGFETPGFSNEGVTLEYLEISHDLIVNGHCQSYEMLDVLKDEYSISFDINALRSTMIILLYGREDGQKTQEYFMRNIWEV